MRPQRAFFYLMENVTGRIMGNEMTSSYLGLIAIQIVKS